MNTPRENYSKLKIDRQQVYNKCNGHCAYCGKEIKYKDMQVDHIWPQHLGGADNRITNLNPSCRRCNHYKRGETLHAFRITMSTLHTRVCSHYIGKVAIDYNIVSITPFDGKFYFEKL